MSFFSSVTFVTHSVDETREFGARLGQYLAPGTVVALSGDLGAGKTSLTQGIALGLGIDARVTSPTFTLVNEYDAGNSTRLIHMDSYRLGDSEQMIAVSEAETFGVEEMLDDEDAVVVIEWAERLASVLPPDCLKITIDSRFSRCGCSTHSDRCHGAPKSGHSRTTLIICAGTAETCFGHELHEFGQ